MLKKSNINNRRYLGNKYKLLPFIRTVIDNECGEIGSIADIFAGTGAVASAFLDRIVFTNDILYSNYICNYAWFAPETYSLKKVKSIISSYNDTVCTEENYMTENFADTYFSFEDCSKIGHIRNDIERRFLEKEINFREKTILITALIYAMDRIAKTCGHYDAYRKGVEYDMSLELFVPQVGNKNNVYNRCYNMDANDLVRNIEPDMIYMDPPYNSRQYCDAYHLLENVAKWEKPDVFGVAKKMKRDKIKSRYCTKKAGETFEDLVKNAKTRYILLSYNNMARKGNDRSNAKIPDEDIFRILEAKGEVKVFSEDYRAFSAGKSQIENNKERLFLCICREG